MPGGDAAESPDRRDRRRVPVMPPIQAALKPISLASPIPKDEQLQAWLNISAPGGRSIRFAMTGARARGIRTEWGDPVRRFGGPDGRMSNADEQEQGRLAPVGLLSAEHDAYLPP